MSQSNAESNTIDVEICRLCGSTDDVQLVKSNIKEVSKFSHSGAHILVCAMCRKRLAHFVYECVRLI